MRYSKASGRNERREGENEKSHEDEVVRVTSSL